MSKKIVLALLLIGASLAPALRGHSAGLAFAGNDRPIDRRTSYDVFAGGAGVMRHRFAVAFDLSMRRSDDLGYILRVKEEEDGKHIFNLFFDGQGDRLFFRFNEEGRSSLASLDVPRAEWPDGEWRRVEIVFDVRRDLISIDVAGHRVEVAGVDLAGRFAPSLVFGRSDHIIDVPSFAVRHLAVECDSRDRLFALDEYDGGDVHDDRGRATGTVSNPQWLIREACEWQLVGEFSSPTAAGAVYDPEAGAVHYLNREQIITLDVRTGTHTVRRFAEPCPVRITHGTCFVAGGRIYVYEVHWGDKPDDGPTIASCDPRTLTWRTESYATLPTRLHHHASWFDPRTGRYTIFGGFGDMHYSRAFHSLDTATGEWRTLPDLDGGRIEPRYFSSLGSEEDGTVLVFGGMGNESGEQNVGRRYFYDLHRVDPAAGRCERLWEISWEGDDMVPVRSMVVADGYFYTLLYPEYLSDSRLMLYRFSIADGSHERMEMSVPIRSDKITTNANLCHDAVQGRLYALVQEFDDDIASGLKVYSLAFPPVTSEQLTALRGGDGRRRTNVVAIVALTLLVAAAAVVMARLRLRGRARAGAESVGDGAVPPRKVEEPRPNSIWLFGGFAAYDVQGRNVSHMFSGLLRRIFCIVLEHTAGGGISSRVLNGMLWPNKAEDKVKSLRNTAIHNLRKVLTEFSGVELVFENGAFRIVTGDGFFCDVLSVREIVRSGVTAANRGTLVDIVSRGKFMKFADGDPILDNYKNSIERMLAPILSTELRRSFEAGDYRAAMDVAEALFNIDPLDDNALHYMVEAMNRLQLKERAHARLREFAAEFKRATGNDYR